MAIKNNGGDANAQPRKKKYDEMSVDDLLSALIDEKHSENSETAAELLGALADAQSAMARSPKASPQRPVKKAQPQKTAPAPQKQAAPAVDKILNEAESAKSPAPKKKRIVISGELPDYEEIRRKELEKDRLARERAALAEEDAKRNAEEKARRKAEEAAAKAKAAEEARAAAEEAAKIKAAEEAKAAAEKAAKIKAAEEAKAAAEKAAKIKAAEEARAAAEKAAEIKAAEKTAEKTIHDDIAEALKAAADTETVSSADDIPDDFFPSEDAPDDFFPSEEEASAPAAPAKKSPPPGFDPNDTRPIIGFDDNGMPIRGEKKSKKKKKGFFAKLKDMLYAGEPGQDDDEDIYEEDENEPSAFAPESFAAPEKAPEPVKTPDEAIADEEEKTEAYDVQGKEYTFEVMSDPDDEDNSADEDLIVPDAEAESSFAVPVNDEELSSGDETYIEEEEQPAQADEDAAAESITGDIAPEDVTADDIIHGPSDPVSSMIDDIREDAASAIADIETKSQDKEEAPDEIDEALNAIPDMDIDNVFGEDNTDEFLTNEHQGMLRGSLSEDPDEIAAARREKVAKSSAKAADIRGKKVLYAALGVLVLILALIGLITIIARGAAGIRRFTTGEAQKESFKEVIYPAVFMDITPFDSPSQLTSDQVITAAIWSVIMDRDKIEKYADNMGAATIPASDVEKYAVELFGSKLPPLTHCTQGPVDSRFYYNAETNSYNVEVRPHIYTYEPDIQTVKKSGDKYTLVVDYLDESPAWMQKTASKKVQYQLTKTDNGYTIDSVKVLSVKGSI